MKQLIITDPCYFMEYDVDFDEGGVNSHVISDHVMGMTGFGDGTGFVLDNIGSVIGTFGVDSGMFGIFILEEVLDCKKDFFDKIPNSCFTIIDNCDINDVDMYFIEEKDCAILLGSNFSTTW